MKIGSAEANVILPERLLESQIVSLAFLRLKIRVREKIERREANEQLGEAWRFESGAITRLQLRLRNRNDVGRRDAPRGLAAKAFVLTPTHARGREQMVHDLRLQFAEPRNVSVPGCDRAVEQPIVLIFDAKQQRVVLGNRNVAEPIKLDPVAVIDGRRRKTETQIGCLNFRTVIGVAKAKRVLELAVKKIEMHLATGENLFHVLLALFRRGNTRKDRKIVAGKEQGRIRVTRDHINPECVGEVRAQLCREGRVFVTIVDSFAPWRQKIQWRHWRVVHQEMR